jgi:predicted nucleic acid-binding protein
MTRAAVDTGALLALASSRDQYHARARSTVERLHRDGGRLVGSALVLGELHGHLLRRTDARTARRVLAALLADPAYDWRDASVELIADAIAGWLDRYADQRFSLTDAVTFELMRRERLTHAFAFDADFQTAGFELLD